MIYLDAGATTLQKPPAVAFAVQSAMRRMATPGRGGHPPAMRAADAVYDCRCLAGALFDAQPEQGVFTMNGGAIIGNTQAGKFDFGNGTTTRYGAAGVYISSGTFIMNGGVIEGNTDEGNNGLAAQVYVRSGEFIMNGGRIEVGTYVDQYNNVKSATTFAVYVNYRGDSASVFTMNGGELCADVRNQAAVYVNGDSKASTVFNLRGGTISATGTSYFEGIEISLYAKMNLSGDPEIDAVIYLNGDSNANRYAEITIDGAFGGTIKGVHGMTYDYTNPPRKLIKIASNGTIRATRLRTAKTAICGSTTRFWIPWSTPCFPARTISTENCPKFLFPQAIRPERSGGLHTLTKSRIFIIGSLFRTRHTSAATKTIYTKP